MDRIMGVLTLRVPTYREIADDPNATRPAGMIVALVALLTGFVAGLVRPDPQNPQALLPVNFVDAFVIAILTVIFALIAWFVSSWVLAFVSRWFGGRTNTNEMLRVTGYVDLFGMVAIVALLALVSQIFVLIVGIITVIASILRMIGYIVGIREAAEFSTGNAIITAIFAVIVGYLIRVAGTVLIESVLSLVGAATGSVR
jgi:hypothetical protein